MERKITLITGGQRSGKSRFAYSMALSESSNPVLIATSRVYDEETEKRIERHKKDRQGQNWEVIEEDKNLSLHDVSGRVVVIDCLTLLANNYFFDCKNDEACLDLLKKEFDDLVQQKAHFIFVTNEIGSCGQSPNEVQRRFTSVLGWFNQYVASKSDEMYYLVSGVPIKAI